MLFVVMQQKACCGGVVLENFKTINIVERVYAEV